MPAGPLRSKKQKKSAAAERARCVKKWLLLTEICDTIQVRHKLNILDLKVASYVW